MRHLAFLVFTLSFFVQVQVHAQIGQATEEQKVEEPPKALEPGQDDSLGLDLGTPSSSAPSESTGSALPAELPSSPNEFAPSATEDTTGPSDVINSVPVEEKMTGNKVRKAKKKPTVVAKEDSGSEKGGFKTAQKECPVYKKMSVGSAILFNLDEGKKVWTTGTSDSKWIKIFRKDGSGAYIKAGCFR